MTEPMDDTLKTAVEAFTQKVRRAREEVCQEELRRCSVALGITPAALCQWMQQPGFPPPDERDRLDTAAIARWRTNATMEHWRYVEPLKSPQESPMKFDPLTTDRLIVAHLRERDLVRLLRGELQIVRDSQLPTGTVVRRVWPSPERQSISLLLAHESFGTVLEGCEPKAMILEFERPPAPPITDRSEESPSANGPEDLPRAPATEPAPAPFQFGQFLGPAEMDQFIKSGVLPERP